MPPAKDDKFRLGLIQTACAADPNENLAKAVWKIREAASRGAQVVCLEELFRSEYFCREENADLFALAEPIPGPTTGTLSTLARELGVVIVASLFERRAAGLYHNTAAVIDADGALAGIYRKTHIPDDPCYYEKFYFTPGDLGFPSFETRFGRIAVLVCWDQWYPEAARLAALGGPTVLLYPTAIGWHPHEKASRGAAQEGSLEFWGSSFVSGPFGEMLAQASTDQEETLIVECDPHHAEEVRRNWPFLRDRRIDAYAPILNRWLG
jgi:N-carbamoylputrescine amidase